NAPFRDVSANLPAGGHLATPEDLVRFALAFNEGKLVQLRTRDLMIQRPKLLNDSDVPDATPYFGMGSGLYYGMGIFVGRAAWGERLLMHTGRDPGASTELLLAPDSKIAVAVMTLQKRFWRSSGDRSGNGGFVLVRFITLKQEVLAPGCAAESIFLLNG